MTLMDWYKPIEGTDYIIGIDLQKRKPYAAVMDGEGQLIDEFGVRNNDFKDRGAGNILSAELLSRPWATISLPMTLSTGIWT